MKKIEISEEAAALLSEFLKNVTISVVDPRAAENVKLIQEILTSLNKE